MDLSLALPRLVVIGYVYIIVGFGIGYTYSLAIEPALAMSIASWIAAALS